MKVFIVLRNHNYELEVHGVYSSLDLAVASAQSRSMFIEERSLDENKTTAKYWPKAVYHQDGGTTYEYNNRDEVEA